MAEAMRHAVAATASERVGELIEVHGWQLLLSGRAAQVLRGCGEVPEETLLANSRRACLAIWARYMRTGSVEPRWRAAVEDDDPNLAVLDATEAARDPERYGKPSTARVSSRAQATSAS